MFLEHANVVLQLLEVVLLAFARRLSGQAIVELASQPLELGRVHRARARGELL